MRGNVSKIFNPAGLTILLVTAVFGFMTVFGLGFQPSWLAAIPCGLILAGLVAIFVSSELDNKKSEKVLEYLLRYPISYQMTVVLKDWQKRKIHQNQIDLLVQGIQAGQQIAGQATLYVRIFETITRVESSLDLKRTLGVLLDEKNSPVIFLDGCTIEFWLKEEEKKSPRVAIFRDREE